VFELVVEKHFSAAHFLPDYPGPCARLHGHNYRVRVYVRGEKLNGAGMVADFGEIKQALMAVLDTLDHQNLNELLPFQETPPTTESIAHFIAHQITPHLSVPVHRVEVWETVGQAAIYYVTSIANEHH
jgi:6-pyruvoyltetrahydropterin/6-carboxytetrahydropterin synthase